MSLETNIPHIDNSVALQAAVLERDSRHKIRNFSFSKIAQEVCKSAR